jgi:MFS family permease
MTIIDKVGRKKLLLIGSVGCAAALAGVAGIFLSSSHEDLLVWALVLFIASFAFSQGAVIWVYLSEVFPTRVRAQGQSLGSFTHWAMNAAISFAFPILAKYSRGLPFVVFAVMMVVQFVVVLTVYPETKGFTLEEMESKIETAA